jgi:hypothetical protein
LTKQSSYLTNSVEFEYFKILIRLATDLIDTVQKNKIDNISKIFVFLKGDSSGLVLAEERVMFGHVLLKLPRFLVDANYKVRVWILPHYG